jgi:molybdopterin converting factor small subunit
MKIHVKSNFVVPGLDNGEFVHLDQSQLTLREFLEELSERSPTRVEYVRSGVQTIDPDEWEIRVNDIPYHQCSSGLGTYLRDGDTVTIIITPLGGG